MFMLVFLYLWGVSVPTRVDRVVHNKDNFIASIYSYSLGLRLRLKLKITKRIRFREWRKSKEVLTSIEIQLYVFVSRLLLFHIWKGEDSACTVLCSSSSSCHSSTNWHHHRCLQLPTFEESLKKKKVKTTTRKKNRSHVFIPVWLNCFSWGGILESGAHQHLHDVVQFCQINFERLIGWNLGGRAAVRCPQWFE